MEYRKFGPKSRLDAELDFQNGRACPGCGLDFAEGDYTTLIPVGPGPDPEEQEKARDGRVYNAVAVEAHWTCVTGQEP